MKQEKEAPAAISSPFKTVKEVEANARTRMDKVHSELLQELSHFRTGRASMTPINQVAQLHVPEPAMITVQPWDTSLISGIEKAIRNADLGLNPSNDGKLIRLPIPPLTEERRRDMAKKLNHVAEERRVGLRNVRRDANDQLKKMAKEKLISADEEKQALDIIQKLTDGQIGKLDQAARAKEKEILEFK
jgi:ribosome recycling factor